MERPLKGDVVVVPFPFSDLSRSKRRPALVAASARGNDVILCQITSQARNDPDAIALKTDDFASGALERPSYARLGHLFTADRGLVLYRIGSLRHESMRAVTERIVQMFTR